MEELAVTGDMSPQERLVKKTELTQDALSMAVEKAEAMRTSLEELEFEAESEGEQLRNQYLNEVSGYLTFYQERKLILDTTNSLEEIDALIQTIIEYRENIYAPSAKNILEFILVFSYGPLVLDTAKERYNNIKADVERLGGLNLIEDEQYVEALEQCQITLDEAEQLQVQARELILAMCPTTTVTEGVPAILPPESGVTETESTTEEVAETIPTTVVLNARGLAEESLNKIKGLYGMFVETGQKIKEALGI